MTTTETKGERKRTTTTKQNTSNIIAHTWWKKLLRKFLGTKPFVIFTDALLKVEALIFFKKVA